MDFTPPEQKLEQQQVEWVKVGPNQGWYAPNTFDSWSFQIMVDPDEELRRKPQSNKVRCEQQQELEQVKRVKMSHEADTAPAPCDDGLVAWLKAEWDAAIYTPPEDNELAREHEEKRSLIKAAVFPALEQVWPKVLEAFWARAGLHTEKVAKFVYESAAKLFYATGTDAYEAKVRAVGEELHAAGEKLDDIGGYLLMHVAIYALKWTLKVVAPTKETLRCGMCKLVETTFKGIGGW